MFSKPNIRIWFELENKCNLKCKFCYNYWKDGFHSAPKNLSAEELIECLNNLFNVVTCDQITLSGGEPLLRKDLNILLDFLSELNIPLLLTTNGLLLNSDKIEWLKMKGVRTFQVPLLSMRSQIHDYLSGKNCFDDSVNALLQLKKHKCDTVVVFVATKTNLAEFEPVLKACALMRINNVIFNRFIPGGAGNLHIDEIGMPSDDEIADCLLGCFSFIKNNNITIRLGVPVDLSFEYKERDKYIIPAGCPVGHGQTKWVLDSGGNLRRCNHSELSIGNLLNGAESILLTELLNHQCCDTSRNCHFLKRHDDSSISPPIQIDP